MANLWSTTAPPSSPPPCHRCQLTSCPSSMPPPPALLLAVHAASACLVAASCSSCPVPVGSRNSRLPEAAAARRDGGCRLAVWQQQGRQPLCQVQQHLHFTCCYTNAKHLPSKGSRQQQAYGKSRFLDWAIHEAAARPTCQQLQLRRGAPRHAADRLLQLPHPHAAPRADLPQPDGAVVCNRVWGEGGRQRKANKKTLGTVAVSVSAR